MCPPVLHLFLMSLANIAQCVTLCHPPSQITEFIAAVDTQGSISVGEDTLVVTKGDRYIDIHVQIQEAPMYGDTLKCKSDVLTDNAIIRIVPGACILVHHIRTLCVFSLSLSCMCTRQL